MVCGPAVCKVLGYHSKGERETCRRRAWRRNGKALDGHCDQGHRGAAAQAACAGVGRRDRLTCEVVTITDLYQECAGVENLVARNSMGCIAVRRIG
jgi:hypothetical protein